MSKSLERLFKVKMSSKGQLVIPKHIREALNLNEGDELLLVPTEEGILMKPPFKEAGRLRGLLKGLDVDIGECEAILSEARRSLAKIIE
ncbi:MAG: AbrB/MazE/SpoVT family DNA-binding domain-containing protein [Nitrososphaerales archaeon]